MALVLLQLCNALPSSVQGVNVIYFTLEAIYGFSASPWIVAVLVLWEGLLGGGAYVNTYFLISKEVRLVVVLRRFGQPVKERPCVGRPEARLPRGLAYPRHCRGSSGGPA